jgi:hypothetical protein
MLLFSAAMSLDLYPEYRRKDRSLLIRVFLSIEMPLFSAAMSLDPNTEYRKKDRRLVSRYAKTTASLYVDSLGIYLILSPV